MIEASLRTGSVVVTAFPWKFAALAGDAMPANDKVSLCDGFIDTRICCLAPGAARQLRGVLYSPRQMLSTEWMHFWRAFAAITTVTIAGVENRQVVAAFVPESMPHAHRTSCIASMLFFRMARFSLCSCAAAATESRWRTKYWGAQPPRMERRAALILARRLFTRRTSPTSKHCASLR